MHASEQKYIALAYRIYRKKFNDHFSALKIYNGIIVKQGLVIGNFEVGGFKFGSLKKLKCSFATYG